MAVTASATFFTLPHQPQVYFFQLTNTSKEPPYSIYSLSIGQQQNLPFVFPGPLADPQALLAPPGWELAAYGAPENYLLGSVNFQGGAGSGYIEPRGVGIFSFASSTVPTPDTIPFSCCFYGDEQWGFYYDDEATRVEAPFWWQLPWHIPFPLPKRLEAEHRAAGTGTTTINIGAKDGPNTVTLTYDNFGNIVRIARRPAANV